MALSVDVSWVFQAVALLGTDEYKLDAPATITGVGNVVKRQVTVPTASEAEILKVDSTGIGAGQLTDISGLVVYNKDTSNWCRLRIEDTGGHTYDIRLDPGQFHILSNTKINVSATGAAFASFSDYDSVSAQFNTADGELIIMACEPCA